LVVVVVVVSTLVSTSIVVTSLSNASRVTVSTEWVTYVFSRTRAALKDGKVQFPNFNFVKVVTHGASFLNL
jgi:hypothetical protein